MKLLVCPICKGMLIRTANTLRCGRGHSYDIAKEGYVNLLLANQKGSSAPGDSKEMLISRRTFLEKGYYAPLSDRINDSVAAHLATAPHPAESKPALLDAGCGEGYYLQRLQQRTAQGDHPALEPDCYGLDISKEAVKLAAQQQKNSSFAVASLHQALPFPDFSLEVLLSVFAPRNAAEFARVLSPSGIVIAVIPAEGHLAQLQSVLNLGRIKEDKEPQIIEAFRSMLSVQHRETLRYTRSLEKEDALNLIKMIPTCWQLSQESWASAHALSGLEVEFAFTIVTLSRKTQSGD